jgi:hypothetical protein
MVEDVGRRERLAESSLARSPMARPPANSSSGARPSAAPVVSHAPRRL